MAFGPQFSFDFAHRWVVSGRPCPTLSRNAVKKTNGTHAFLRMGERKANVKEQDRTAQQNTSKKSMFAVKSAQEHARAMRKKTAETTLVSSKQESNVGQHGCFKNIGSARNQIV